MLKEFVKKIKFERSQLVFTSGESISGTLSMQSTPQSTYKIQELCLTLINTFSDLSPAEMRPWRCISELIPNGGRTSNKCSFNLLNSSDGSIALVPNKLVELPFTLNLPSSLASTFMSRYAVNSYSLKLSGSFRKQYGGDYGVKSSEELLFRKDILIIGLVQLPQTLSYGVSHSRRCRHKNKDGKEVVLSVTLDNWTKWVFPGQMIKFNVEITNGLSLPLNMVRASLQQNITYKLMLPVPKEAKVVAYKEGPQIPPGPQRRVVWKGEIEVPHVIPSGMGETGCPFISIDYIIQFTLTRFVNLRVSYPVHITTGVQDEERDWDTMSLAYGQEMTQSFRESQFSLDVDSISLLNGDESCWTPVSLSCLSLDSGPPSYKSEWNVETAPPDYEQQMAVGASKR